jgi:hypothetical protein
MRRAGALAAAVILALALGAPGCKPSSLTPLFIGTQDYSGGNLSVNGTWAGKTANGGDVTLQIGSDMLSRLKVLHVETGCTLTFEVTDAATPIVDNVFTVEILYDQGRFVATGTFTTADTCSGTYFFEALGAGVCPTSGTGSFTAEKTTL